MNALLEDAGKEVKLENEHVDSFHQFMEIPLTQIEANPNQPRTEFDEEALDELATSIALHGLIQPITVRKASGRKYQIISGERRFRASQKAHLNKVPVYVRKTDDQGLLEMALIENIQREDLNAMEIATTYKRLLDECEIRQEELGKRVGKKRSTVTNYLRLLKLPTELQIALRANLITMGHARAMISIPDPHVQKQVLEDTLEKDYSVRQVERIVKEILEGKEEKQEEEKKPEAKTRKNIANGGPKPNYDTILWEDKISSAWNRNVRLKIKSNGKGEMIVPFDHEKDLQEFIALVQKRSKKK